MFATLLYKMDDQYPKEPAKEHIIADKVCAIIAENLCFEIKQVTPDKDIQQDLSADSLDMVETIMAIETHFKIAIPDEKMESFSTVGDVVAYVEREMGGKTYIPKEQ